MRVEFRHHVVRDLAWVIGSASLLAGEGDDRVSDAWCRLAWYDRIPWLRELDRSPEGLTDWLAARRSPLLGHYFESLIEYWLRHWRRMTVHAVRLPVRWGERDIGEFDLLFRDRFHDTDFHWECAVKFFLRYRHAHGSDEWLGPNPRDTLLRKWRKVFDQQLPLAGHPAAELLLAQLGIEALRSKAFIKGYLFYPASAEGCRPESVPSESSPHHLRGWWCHAAEVEAIPVTSAKSRWFSLSRFQWLSPVRSRELSPGMGHEAMQALLRQHFAGSDRPLLLAELARDGSGLWRERSRGFVVADHWPHPATGEVIQSRPMKDQSLYSAAYQALMAADPDEKVRLTHALYAAWRSGALSLEESVPVDAVPVPGRPERPQLVKPRDLPKRKPATLEGRAVLFHALTHIEFNAINLGLDAAYRFRGMPRDYYDDWLRIADEEASHFVMLREHLRAHGYDYGDYPGHNGLWEMAQKTAHDVMVRMALVPRCLEARGLDVNPGIKAKLLESGDAAGAAKLDVILRDEIGHVAVGNRWFRYLCEQRALEPMATYNGLIDDYMQGPLRPPFHIEARREAGFSEEELAYLEGVG